MSPLPPHPPQAGQVLQFIYCGQVEGVGVAAAGDLLHRAAHLQVDSGGSSPSLLLLELKLPEQKALKINLQQN